MILSKYVFYGKIDLTLKSVLRIGGEDDLSGMLAVNGAEEYIIPASGFTGAARSYLESVYGVKKVNEFFGFQFKDKGSESKVIVYDATFQLDEDNPFEERVGVKIDRKTGAGAAEQGNLYTQMYIARGAKASMFIEAYCSSVDEFDDMFATIVGGIDQGLIVFGAKKTNGAGVFSAKGYRKTLDLSNEADRRQFFRGIDQFDFSKDLLVETDIATDAMDVFTLEASIPDGILISDGVGTDELNKVNMKHADDTYYLPGSSIKGVLRAYARRIVSSLGIDESIVGETFGWDGNSDVKTGSVLVEDCELEGKINAPTVYNRIKIDRLTGGTFSGAKMTEGVLNTKENETVSIRVRLDHRYLKEDDLKAAQGLLFLALRDLGAGYIGLGGGNAVGHGRLRGKTLKVNDQSYSYSWIDGVAEISVDNQLVEEGIEQLKGRKE